MRFLSYIGRKIVGLFLLAGVVLTVLGFTKAYDDSKRLFGAEEYDLAAIETGTDFDAEHVSLGSHYRLYSELIYKTVRFRGQEDGPDSRTPVAKAYYPIISPQHPLASLLARADTPEGARSDIGSVSVLVRTHAFRRVSDLPVDSPLLVESDAISGILKPASSTLNADEKQLILEGFPRADFSRMWVLDEDEEDSDLGFDLGMAATGLACIFIPLFISSRLRRALGGAEEGAEDGADEQAAA